MTQKETKLYSIVRKDLEMPPGKMAAQAGHAFLEAFLASPPQEAKRYRQDSIGTKIVLEGTLFDILDAKDRCEELDIPCVLIEDSGHVLPPHFDGTPIITALGVGLSPRASNILSQFKLLGAKK